MIQEKLQEIHHKFGISEMANYKIQLFIDSLIEQDRVNQLLIQDVRKCSCCERVKKLTHCEDCGNDIGIVDN
jgi:ssDNA-binding replication factor A large subunit